MQELLQQLFLDEKGRLKDSKQLAATILIIPEIYDAPKVKFYIKEWLKNEGINASFIPEITSLFELARKIAGVSPGEVIRLEDFMIILEKDTMYHISPRYKDKKFKYYKHHLYMLLSMLSMSNIGFDELDTGELEKVDLTLDIVNSVLALIKGRGFIFRGEVYKKALAVLNEDNTFGDNHIYMVPGRFHSEVERDLLNGLKRAPVTFSEQNKFRGIREALFNHDDTIAEDPESQKLITFLKARSGMDMIKQVKHSIFTLMEKDQTLNYNDFTIVSSVSDTAVRLASYFAAQGIPFNSSVNSNKYEGILLALMSLKVGLSNDIKKALYFYNYYFNKRKRILKEDLASAKDIFDIKKLIEELSGNHDRTVKMHLDDEGRRELKKFLTLIHMYNAKKEDDLETVFAFLNKRIIGILVMLGEDLRLNSIFSYKEVILHIFGERVSYLEAIDYIIEILFLENRSRLGEEYNGINLITQNEQYFTSRYVYYVDLEESDFLKSGYYNRLLDEDTFMSLEKRIFTETKEEYLKRRFCSMLSDQVDRVYFVLPASGEDVVVSAYMDNLLRIFPRREYRIKVAGNDMLKPANIKFHITTHDVLKNGDAMLPVEEPVAVIKREVHEDFAFEVRFDTAKLEKTLNTATAIERFCSCPAQFAGELKLEYDVIETDDKYRAGNIFHTIMECFITYYTGKDLIKDEAELLLVTTDLPMARGKDTVSPTKLDRFAVEYLADKLEGVPLDQEAAPGFYKLARIIDESGVFEVFKEYHELELERDSNNNKRIQNELLGIIKFLAQFIIQLGITPVAVTKTFKTEVLVRNFKLGVNKLRLLQGFIDFMYIDHRGEIHIIDFKSARLDDYEDEMKQYHIVQLLMYREIVKRALAEGDFSYFSDAGLAEEIKEKKQRYTTVDEAYFLLYRDEEYISARYLSNKGLFKVEVIGDYTEFTRVLKERLGAEGSFIPESNKNCKYCHYINCCHLYEESNIDLAGYQEHFTVDDDGVEYVSLEQDRAEATAGDELPVKTFIQFTDDKREAISNNKQDIVISAGAGAGKTEVLSSKYIKLLIDENVSIENIVCITFTNKAVGEMKNRIIAKLSETIESGYFFALKQPDMQAYRLSPAQIKKLQYAKLHFSRKNRIRTFHSFCKNILEKYGKTSEVLSEYDLESYLPPEYLLKEEKIKIIKEANRNGYQEFLDGSAITDEEKEVFFSWLKNEVFYYDIESSKGGFLIELLNLIDRMNLSGRDMNKWHFDFDRFKASLDKIKGFIKAEYAETKSGVIGYIEDVRGLFEEKRREILKEMTIEIGDDVFNTRRLRKNNKSDTPEMLAAIDGIKNRIGELKDALYYKLINNEKGLADTNVSRYQEYAVKKVILRIAAGLDKKIERFKKDFDYIEQDDFHRLVIRLLENDHALLMTLKREFTYFLLDEFQDTNWLQSKIINLLHTNADNYLFIVGDLKQSIYRFQQCDNQIFYNYINSPDCKYLTFTDNYRSKKELIDFNNYYFYHNNFDNFNIFKHTSRDRKKPEFATSPRAASPSHPMIHFSEICYDKEKYGTVLSDAVLNHITKVQEARYICNIIKSNPGKSWGILIRSYTRIDYLIESLKEFNIPYSFIMKKGLFDLKEVNEFITVLKVCLNLKLQAEIDYIPDIASVIAEVKDERLIDKGLLYIAMHILYCGIYQEHLQRFTNYNQKMQNILQVLDVIAEATSVIGDDILETVYYLDKIKEYNTRGIMSNEDSTVKIMTVHSAKGLEFDNLIIANISNYDRDTSGGIKFVNLVEDEGNFIDFTIGGIKDIGGDYRSRFFSAAWMDNTNSVFNRKESANLLYVAFTRAKSNIFVTMLKNGLSKNSSQTPTAKWLKNIEQNLFARAFDNLELGSKCVPVDGIRVSLHKVPIDRIAPVCELTHDSVITVEKGYDVSAFTSLQKLISVSDYIAGDEPLDYEPGGEGVREYSPTDLGNFVHAFFEEHIALIQSGIYDFSTLFEDFTESYPVKESQKLIAMAKKLITGGLTNKDFLTLIGEGSLLYTEQDVLFNHGDEESGFIEGIIDLMIVRDDEVVILDYKTHTAHGDIAPNVMAQYHKQLTLYGNAAADIFSGKTIRKYLFVLTPDKAKLVAVDAPCKV